MKVTGTPAYGRDYKTAKAARADWQAGKDFILQAYGHPYDGKYFNRPQAEEEGLTVYLRFCKLAKSCLAENGGGR